MKSLQFQVRNNVTGSEVFIPDSMDLNIVSFSKHSQLGFFDATINVTGTLQDVFSVLNWLNYDAFIFDESGIQWYGFVNTATIRTGSITYNVSLDSMYNSVAAVFTDESRVSVKTDYTEDDYSVTIYDRKQLLLSIDNASLESVQDNIERILNETKYPKASFNTSGLTSDVTEATIECLGPLLKAQWIYYGRDFGLIENVNSTGSLKSGLQANGRMAFQATDNSFISDIDGELISFDKDDKVYVLGTVSNDGLYIVESGTNEERETLIIPAGQVVFNGSTLTDGTGNLDIFRRRDYIEIVSGEANDGLYIVDSVAADGKSLTIIGTFPSNFTSTLTHYITKGTTIRMANDTITDENASNAFIVLMGNQIAQSFTPDHSFDVKFLSVDCKKINDPSFGIRLSLYTDSGNTPGTEITGIDIPFSSISHRSGEIVGELASLQSITSGTQYWFVITSLGVSHNSYYEFSVDEDTTFAGDLLLGDNNSSWTVPTIDSNLVFKVIGGEETTTQIEILLDSVPGIRNVGIYNPSNLITAPYRDGMFLAYEELIELMNLGTSNQRRLLAKTLIDGDIILIEEPSDTNVEYYIDIDSNIFDRFNNKLDNAMEIVGNWVGLNNFIPSGIGTTTITSPSPVFIESVEYIPGEDRFNIQSKTEEGLFNLRG